MRALFMVNSVGVHTRTNRTNDRFLMPHQALGDFNSLVPTLATKNVGNIIHREAMPRIVKCDAKGSTVGMVSGLREEDAERGIAYMNQHFDAVFLSFANAIKHRKSKAKFEESDEVKGRFRALAELARTYKGALYVFGLGIQDELEPDPAEIPPEMLEMLRAFDAHARIVAVRGPKTEEWLHAVGLTRAVATGCPSLFVNPWATLSIQPVVERGPVRMTAAGRLSQEGMREERLQPLLKLAAEHDADFVFQNDAMGFVPRKRGDVGFNYLTGEIDQGFGHMRERRITGQDAVFRRYFMFPNPDMWRGYASGRDLYVGDRFHGGVAFVQAGKPAGFVYKDARVRELTGYFGLPAFTCEEVMAAPGGEIVARVNAALPAFRDSYAAALDKFMRVCDEGGVKLVYDREMLPR